MIVIKDEKTYSRRQIEEAIAHWESELMKMGESETQSKETGGVTDVSMEAALESLGVYDKVVGVQYGLKNDYNIKFTEDFIDLVKSLVMTDRYRGIRKYYLGVKFVSDDELEEYDDRLTREEKIEDERYILQEEWKNRADANNIFKPASTLVADGVRYENRTGVGICVLYAFW